MMTIYKTVRNFLRSWQFFTLCMTMTMIAFFGPFAFRVDGNLSRVEEIILEEVRDSNIKIENLTNKVDEQTNKIEELEKANRELTENICVLQRQIESLGAKPDSSLVVICE